MRLGKVGNIPLIINPFFLLLLLGVAIGGYLIETIVLFTVVFFHEMAHSLVAKGFGLHIKEIELYPFGGVARLEGHLELDPQAEKNVSLAGPLFNFILAGAALTLYTNGIIMGAGLLFFVRLNLTLGFFNLLPALPLDGGRILRAALAPSLGFRRATDFALRLSTVLAFLLFVGGLVTLILGYKNTSILVVSLFLFFAINKEQKAVMYQLIRYLVRKKEDLEAKGALPATYIAAVEDATLKEIIRLFSPKKYHRVLVLNENLEVVGEVGETEIIDKVLKEGTYLKVKKLVK